LFFAMSGKGWHCRCFWGLWKSTPNCGHWTIYVRTFGLIIITATRDLPPKTDPPLKWKRRHDVWQV
jgi:hypothetical protein